MFANFDLETVKAKIMNDVKNNLKVDFVDISAAIFTANTDQDVDFVVEYLKKFILLY